MDAAEDWRRARRHLDTGFDGWVEAFFAHLGAPHVEAVRQVLAAGKRLRGCLTCLVCEALAGDPQAALPRAVAIECIQAASLVHDDYVDQDRMRRNRPALWTVVGPRRAVLLGDVIFATVIQRMVALGLREGAVAAGAIATMASGAYQELASPEELAGAIAAGEYGDGLYDRLIQLKTGALFAAAAELGALAAHAPPELVAHAAAFGARLGQAYQIADDLADLHDDAGVHEAAAVVPAVLHFAPETAALVLGLLGGQQLCWPAQLMDTLERRMRAAIAQRLDLASQELTGFPVAARRRLTCALAGVISLPVPASA